MWGVVFPRMSYLLFALEAAAELAGCSRCRFVLVRDVAPNSTPGVGYVNVCGELDWPHLRLLLAVSRSKCAFAWRRRQSRSQQARP
ncbi:hypothetical protein CC85DRAFT_282878 [Cutaneotrichosporon oleaginosum]|uniref:Secreted protein n=1 Tax=Cutaneotrichosporon oleaginosum TaxID=879819 RepID=A0A0J0XV64_9TREE|nr:uncharacterized protein CC85DRAFT_282878 [Cutaneotrichosporon oleaginosum]KLT44957.1 hypothetical protein CC85DRAFT_282878 [Cutaneotrichosporon oleaginosum]TXT09646.1 hypothetical protein COLE_03580 [Cutaneotrichosporon oleaginosum]